MQEQRTVIESRYRRQKLLAEKRMAEKIAEYNRQLREGKKPWEIEGREVRCPVCGDTQFFMLDTGGPEPGSDYHLLAETEQRGTRRVKTGRSQRDSYGRRVCVCDCSWDEASQRVGPQTARGIAKVKARITKQQEIPF